MITVDNLTVTARTRLFTDFSYNFVDGTLYLITAENGSGKTTLLRTIVNFVRPDVGEVRINGARYSAQKQQVFFWESSDWFNLNLSGQDYLEFVHHQWQSTVAIAPVIEYWGMGEYIKVPVKKYSLGMKQRLIVAMYEVSGAQNLLMDEISNGLDKDARGLLYTKLRQLADDGKCVLITSHYRDEIVSYVDQQLAIENQRVQEVQR